MGGRKIAKRVPEKYLTFGDRLNRWLWQREYYVLADEEDAVALNHGDSKLMRSLIKDMKKRKLWGKRVNIIGRAKINTRYNKVQNRA